MMRLWLPMLVKQHEDEWHLVSRPARQACEQCPTAQEQSYSLLALIHPELQLQAGKCLTLPQIRALQRGQQIANHQHA